MATSAGNSTAAEDRQWFIVGRWQEYEGEERANVLRLLAIAAFYIVELINYYGLKLGILEFPQIPDRAFHLSITALAVSWVMVGMAVQLSLHRQFFPASLKFISTGCDLLLLTCAILMAAGPRSPLVAGYFLVIALSALRFSLPLVRFATVGSLVGYLVLLGRARWFAGSDLRVPRYHELIVVLTIALTGIILGQVIRRVRALAEDYAARLARVTGGHGSPV
jgi:hypothetical protein